MKSIDEMFKMLKKIEFYKKFPSMIPFIGDNYISRQHKKLLLIGESYYLPNRTKLHHSASKWYLSNRRELSEEEVEWIDCDGLLRCNWDSDGHHIYRELNSCLFSLDINKTERGIDEVAFTNYFQRPSEKEGESIRNYCCNEDLAWSRNILEEVINIIDPNIIIFVSKYAWDMGGLEMSRNYKEIYFDFVCHPGTGGRYWHNKKYPNNKRKFLKLLNTKYVIK